MRRTTPIALLALALPLMLVACSETTSSGGSGRDAPLTDRGSRDSGAKPRDEAEATRLNEAAMRDLEQRGQPQPKAAAATGDARVMLYEPKTDNLLIMVNESHSGRKTEAGRINLALGDRSRAYKILTDVQMGALLESLENNGFRSAESRFEPGDEQYLTTASRDLPNYKGIVFVERGGARSKALGFRPASRNDPAAVGRLKTFTDMKPIIMHWFGGTSMSELPTSSVAMPEKPSRRGTSGS